jgi:UDP-glucose 4-epimerase
MKILVIGSKGFIGQHALDYFRSKGYEVLGCDVVTDYEDSNYIQIDATNSDYHFIFENHAIDICLNCSGAASVPLSLQFPLKDFTLNTLNVFKILDAIRTLRPECKFLNLSSAAVYGNPTSLPIAESSDLKPLSPYGIHKLQAEEICSEFYQYYQIATCSVRIFSAYGNGLKKQLFWDMYKKCSNGGSIELYGTGKESRDFIHIDDIVNALELVIEKAAFNGEQINLANGEEYTIKTVSDLFRKHLDTDIQINFNNQVKAGDPLNWRADIAVLKAMGYQPQVSLEDGIESYIRWVKTLN